jgi:glycosyltransferase involved in cell wall biosynthesis
MTSLRTLVIAEGLPYPPVVGKDLRNWLNICGLSTVSQVGVFGLWSNDPRRNNVPPRHLEFWRLSTDAALTYPPPKHISVAARAWPLYPLGHPSDLYYSETAATEIAEVMASFKPEIVVVEGLWRYRYIDVLKHFRCRIVLDCHNVEAAVFQEIADATDGDELPARLVRKLLPARTKMIEQKAVHAVDQIWVCSENDARLMEELYGVSAGIHVVPNGIDVDSYEVARARQYQRPEGVNPNGKVLIFPALFGWKPNVVAALFLIQEFFPQLASVFPDCQLLLAGGGPTPEMTAAAQGEPRIVVTGAVPDMRSYLAAASATIVPLFQGGGTRFKILEAFAANVPVISTAKGAEGLAVQDGTHLLIAETAGEFVDAVQRLWTDERLGKHLAANGLELVKQSYSFPVIGQRIAKAVDELASDG